MVVASKLFKILTNFANPGDERESGWGMREDGGVRREDEGGRMEEGGWIHAPFPEQGQTRGCQSL